MNHSVSEARELYITVAATCWPPGALKATAKQQKPYSEAILSPSYSTASFATLNAFIFSEHDVGVTDTI